MTANPPTPPPVPPAPAARRMSGGRIALVVVGALAALVGFGLLVAAAVAGWAHGTQRDDDGFYRSGGHRLATTTHAITSDRIDLGAGVEEGDWVPFDDIGTAEVVARAPGRTPIFIGIAPSDDVDRYLDDVAHDRVEDIGARPFEADDVDYDRIDGTATPGAPAAEDIWVASAQGPGRQVLRWEVDQGDWTVVLMNADASPVVAANVAVGLRTDLLLPIAIGLVVAGVLALALAALLLTLGLRHAAAWEGAVPAVAELPEPVVLAASYPARLDARLEPGLSRWLWLVKWVLVIPHVIVLAFLWLAAFVLTVLAGFAILFTGRYPRAIFDFNVGVARWTWRVGFYSFAAFGTDRYPPFSLQPDPGYPADLTVDHPERLNRWLVLVKWWLLAIPHLVLVAIFTGGWGFGGDDDRWRVAGGGGLIAVVALIAVVIHAVRGAYPRELFHFVMGLNRWVFRVWAYVWLMRDEYPPFRFDGGGTDPGSMPAFPPAPRAPEAPASDEHLVGTAGSEPPPPPERR